ncbi:iron-sulfur cluster assembly scaffold protein [uncultured Maricaulis sp.]|uniref:iron-sulfur cluster assembly scaffold protein n=1 Tax=uncultured Maricaulis sp. TaxID=174710 RepID=UPI0030D9842E|tara:strand:+ start:161485 stop:161937 length:453 start_codon:yes stop_codon:yes gene_type:complete
MSDDLYSNAVLRLAADIPRIGRLARPDASVRKVSRLCGSEVELDIMVQSGHVADLALRVKACALGQASAAILARAAIGASLRELELARDNLKAMLKQSGPAPRGRFAELQLLQSARAYPARHQSIMLAFDAAVEAATKARTTRIATPLTG